MKPEQIEAINALEKQCRAAEANKFSFVHVPVQQMIAFLHLLRRLTPCL